MGEQTQPTTDSQFTNENRAVITPDQPCAVCGAEHNENDGTVTGRMDPESDAPFGLLMPENADNGVQEASFCNDCIEAYLMDIQSEVKILTPRQAQAAAYLLLGLQLREAHEMINAREGEGALTKGTVHDYRTRARRSVLEAIEMASALGPILRGPGTVDKYYAEGRNTEHPNQDKTGPKK